MTEGKFERWWRRRGRYHALNIGAVTLGLALIGLCLAPFVVILYFEIEASKAEDRCDIECGPIQHKMMDRHCYCATPSGGWEHPPMKQGDKP